MTTKTHMEILANMIRSIEMPTPIWHFTQTNENTVLVDSPANNITKEPTFIPAGYEFLAKNIVNNAEVDWDDTEFVVRVENTQQRCVRHFSEALYQVARGSISNRKERREFADKIGYHGTSRLAGHRAEQILAIAKAFYNQQIDQYMVRLLYERLYDTYRSKR